MLRSDFCDYSDVYIVKGDIIVINPNDVKRNKSVAFKNNASFINCISKINGVQIDNAEDLDVVIPMYIFLEYSKKYRKTTERLWNYHRDEPSNPLSSNFESFKYKKSITGNTYNVGDVKLIMMEIKLVKMKLKLLLLFLFYQNDIHVFANNIYNTIKKVHIYEN